MMQYSATLEAEDAAKNIRRSYGLSVGQDLFGDWIVEVRYGRIGSRGRSKMTIAEDRADAMKRARKILKRREGSVKRIGVPYELKASQGTLDPEPIQDD
jgi:predicted DNA-binding WGR domain protein